MSERRKSTKNQQASTDEQDIEYLDENEQKEFIKRMLDENEKQNKWSRTAFTLVALLLAIGKTYYALSQFWYPWYLQPHAEFSQRASVNEIAVIELLSAISFFLTACTTTPWIYPNNVYIKTWTLIGAILSTLIASYMLFTITGFELSMIMAWFVGGNIALELCAYYVESLVKYAEKEVMALSNYTYNFKKP